MIAMGYCGRWAAIKSWPDWSVEIFKSPPIPKHVELVTCLPYKVSETVGSLISREDAVARILAATTDENAAYIARCVAIALDPVAALLPAIGWGVGKNNTGEVQWCRAMFDCFGTSHLRNPAYSWRFATWGSGLAPTGSERRLAADRSEPVREAFGASGVR